MPSSLLNADTSFPQLDGNQSQEEKMTVIVNYLYMLLEQLRYTLGNLGMSNFNESELDAITKIITDPVYIQLSDTQGNVSALQVTAESLVSRMSDAEGNVSVLFQTSEMLASQISDNAGNISILTQTAASLTARISNAEGSISTLTQTAASLTTRISNSEGNISTLNQTATSLSARITNAEGSISNITQTVNSITLSVANGEESSTIRLMKNGVVVTSQIIRFDGMVLFNDLRSNNSYTVINGGNITTGTISAITINACTINACTINSSEFNCLLSSGGSVSGELSFYYISLSSNRLAGGIRLDDNGAGTSTESAYRLIIYTGVVSATAFALKLQSAGNMSLQSDGLIYMDARTDITLSSQNINLWGTVKVNGTTIG